MNILLSNDDGINAPGIRLLATALSQLATVYVLAPDRNRSGASNSLTLSRPLHVHQLEEKVFSVEGTPTDCVHLGVTGFLDVPMDMVISGINEGANLGDDVLYSGTVAAAMEGRNLGLPAIAVSLVGQHVTQYNAAVEVVCDLVRKLITRPFPMRTIFNINIPYLPLSKIQGIQVTRLGTRHQAEPVIKEYDPRGRPIYWIGPPGVEADAGPGTDFYAVSQGYVSVTPIQVDLTHYTVIDQVDQWFRTDN